MRLSYPADRVDPGDLAEVAVMALAAMRLTRLVVLDTIWEESRARWHARLSSRGEKWADKLVELTGCVWCTGYWVSLIVWMAARGRPPVKRKDWFEVWAVAGLQGLLNAVEPDS